MKLSKTLESGYRLKVSEEKRAQEDDSRSCFREMGAARGNGDFQILHQQGGRLIEKAISRCEEVASFLIELHISNGDRDPAKIAETIGSMFIQEALSHVPGASLYASLRGTNKVAGMRMLQSSRAEFEGRRNALIRSLGDKATLAVSASSTTRLGRLKRWAENNGVTVAVLVVVGVLGIAVELVRLVTALIQSTR